MSAILSCLRPMGCVVVICDTCGKETDKVYRVVIDKGYDRSSDPPLYNCKECFEKKDAERHAHQTVGLVEKTEERKAGEP